MEAMRDARQLNENFVERPERPRGAGDFGVNGGSRAAGGRGISLLVAIPCFNEAESIAGVVAAMPDHVEGIDTLTVLVVDDGSADGTGRLAAEAGAVVIRHGVNRGVGAAFDTAVEYALERHYDLMVNIDGDNQFDPTDIPKLVAPILAGEADMTTASRFADPALVPDMPPAKLYGNKLMSAFISALVGVRYYDVSCGFRCYSRESLLRLNLQGAFTYTQETFIDLSVKRMRIREVPIKVVYFAGRRSRVAGNLFKYGLKTSNIILRSYRDYYPLRFFWSLALVFAAPSLILGWMFFSHYFATGLFSGSLYAGFSSAFLFMMATVFFVLGIVADMLVRLRANQGKILYRLKKYNLPRDGGR